MRGIQGEQMIPRKRPTDAELAVLRVLWTRGRSTAREVVDALDRVDSGATVLRLLQTMTKKELVRRDQSSRPHVYEATVTEARAQRLIVADLH